jgi:5'-phosphate synthase pdxT subunit
MAKLARIFDLLDPLRERIADGLPVFGTCAGMILLADRIEDGTSDQETLGGLDITVRRNAFGRQVDSFEAPLAIEGIEGGTFPAVFIRAPFVERAGDGVEVLATVDGHPVVCRQGAMLVTAFHPELSDDLRMHEYFIKEMS